MRCGLSEETYDRSINNGPFKTSFKTFDCIGVSSFQWFSYRYVWKPSIFTRQNYDIIRRFTVNYWPFWQDLRRSLLLYAISWKISWKFLQTWTIQTFYESTNLVNYLWERAKKLESDTCAAWMVSQLTTPKWSTISHNKTF